MSVKSMVTEGLLTEAAKWNLPLNRPSAEAIAEEISLPQAMKLRGEPPSDQRAADKVLVEKRAILRQATRNAIAKTADVALSGDLRNLLAAVDEIDTPA